MSPKTVSRVIGGGVGVAAATRARVEAEMTALAYAPSPAARALRSGLSGLVGVVTGAISGGASGPVSTGLPSLHILRGLQEGLEAVGLTPIYMDAGRDPARAATHAATLARHRVEGMIHVHDYLRRIDAPALGGGAPAVLVNAYGPAGVPAILPDDREGQRALTASLLGMGFARIAYVGLEPELDATRHRLAGRAAALDAAGVSDDAALTRTVEGALSAAPNAAKALWAALDGVLAARPDVICFGNDALAMRGYGMLRARGIDLPGDVAVAGYDDQRSITEMLYPTLTSVELPYHAMGRAAAAALLARMRDPEGPVPPPLRVRGAVVHRDSVVARGGAGARRPELTSLGGRE